MSHEQFRHITRRQFMREAAAAVAGLGVGAVAAVAIEHGPWNNPAPLRPENGNAENQLVIKWLPPTVTRWASTIEQYSQQYQIDPNVPAIIMTIESGGDPRANSGVAKGLMQITEARAQDIAAKFLQKPVETYDLYDPDTAIEFGVANIRKLIDEFGTSSQAPTWDKTVGLVAAGYFGGEGSAREYRDKGLDGVKGQGTYNYIRYVTTMWRERYDSKSFAYRYWHDQANGEALVSQAQKYKKK